MFSVVKRLPEHIQVDNPEVLKKLAKKLERQQVSYRYVSSFVHAVSDPGRNEHKLPVTNVVSTLC